MSGDTTVIIGSILRQLCFQQQFFGLTRLQFFGLRKCSQLAQRLSHFSLRGFQIQLHSLPAGYSTDIGHFCNCRDCRALYGESQDLCLELRIG